MKVTMREKKNKHNVLKLHATLIVLVSSQGNDIVVSKKLVIKNVYGPQGNRAYHGSWFSIYINSILC